MTNNNDHSIYLFISKVKILINHFLQLTDKLTSELEQCETPGVCDVLMQHNVNLIREITFLNIKTFTHAFSKSRPL